MAVQEVFEALETLTGSKVSFTAVLKGLHRCFIGVSEAYKWRCEVFQGVSVSFREVLMGLPGF